jgi:RNase adapter protein RapZ
MVPMTLTRLLVSTGVMGKTARVHRVLIVTGMSGAGRSTASAALEDLGWYVIDNLPTAIIEDAVDLVCHPARSTERVAFILGRSGPVDGDALTPILDRLATTYHVDVLYLDADDDVLVRRFEGTRRKHPRSLLGVAEAIAEERAALTAVREHATATLDTTELNTNQLRLRIRDLFDASSVPATMRTSITSFGFKHGIPLDVDLVFDVRFLPNPHWEPALRPQSGLDDGVRDFVLRNPETTAFLDQLDAMLTLLLPSYAKEGKSYVTVAIGCTGGRHRSVAIAEAIAERLRAEKVVPALNVFHRDIDR